MALNVLSFVFLCLFGWSWPVGPSTGLLSVLFYGFSHAGFRHLLFNMWALRVFGNPVNRRLGNGYYLLGYLGTLLGMACGLAFVLLLPQRISMRKRVAAYSLAEE